MGRVMVAGGKPDMAAPVGGLLLSSVAEGSIVKLNENGSPVEFYVAKHNYEPDLNGNGRSLLVRKDLFDSRVWNSTASNIYGSSSIDSWLNSDYKSLFDNKTLSAIGTTKSYCAHGSTTVSALERSIFLLSHTEMGFSGQTVEGSSLPINERLRTAYFNGEKQKWWIRTHGNGYSDRAWVLTGDSGIAAILSIVTETYYSRPCFTIPETAYFDPVSMLFMGVS